MKFLIAKRTERTETSQPDEMFGGNIVTSKETDVWWTDETCSSRYGIGTISFDGDDHGPADIVPGDSLGRTVAQWLCDSYSWGTRYGRDGFYSQEEIEILRRFCSQWPDGPQFTTEKW